VVESVTLGLGYAAVLIWGGAALVAAFSPYEVYPYWPAIPNLRTDTSGVLAFIVSLVALTVSRYLELRRRRDRGDLPVKPVARPAGVLAVQALADAAVVCATGLVIYLSLNAIVHPWTLRMQLTHLLSWPSEGTVRVIGLAVCWVAVATRRYLRVTATRPVESAASPGQAAPAPETQAQQRQRMAARPDWPAQQRAREPWQGNGGR
jgi:hypothetical protein